MFDKMSIMASRGPVKYLFKYLNLCHCFDVNFHFYKFHGVLGSDWVLALEISLKYCSLWHSTGKKRLQSHSGMIMGEFWAINLIEALTR